MKLYGLYAIDGEGNYAFHNTLDDSYEIPWYNFKNMSSEEIHKIINYKNQISIANLFSAGGREGEINLIKQAISDDLKKFKELTYGNVVIMGRKTAMSLPHKYLKGRINIILSSNPPKELIELEKENKVKLAKSYNEIFEYLSSEKLLKKEINVYAISLSIIKYLLGKELIKELFITEFSFAIKRTYKPEVSRLNIQDDFPFIFFNEYKKYEVKDKNHQVSHIIYKYKFNSEHKLLGLIEDVHFSRKIKKMRANKVKYIFNDRNLVFEIKEVDKDLYLLPMITHRQSSLKAIMSELMWIIRGETDTSKLFVNVWKENTTREFLDKRGLNNLEEGDIGATYGHQMRHFGQIYEKRYGEIVNEKGGQLSLCKDTEDTIMEYCFSGGTEGSARLSSTFIETDEFKYITNGVDQLQNLLDLIKKDPFSSRLIIDLWNPIQMDSMSLPPCVYCYNFDVEPNENGNPYILNLKVIQRSSDILLAGGWNITSACLFLILLSKFTKLKPGKVIWSPSNVHIYENNWEITKTILQKVNEEESRIPYPLIKIKNTPEKFDEFKYEDIELYNYENEGKVEVNMNT